MGAFICFSDMVIIKFLQFLRKHRRVFLVKRKHPSPLLVNGNTEVDIHTRGFIPVLFTNHAGAFCFVIAETYLILKRIVF